MKRRVVFGRFVLALALAGGFALPGCGDTEKPPPVAPRRVFGPAWQDVFDTTPDYYVVIRTQAFKRDAVYGALFKSAMRAAAAESPVRDVTALEAAEGCDEIVVGIKARGGSGGPVDDAVIVFRGVPANLDAEKMVDAQSGARLFRRVAEHRGVVELERVGSSDASLFVLPDRTWVVAVGEARVRGREAFTTPAHRPVPKTDPTALAVLRIDATPFVDRPRVVNSPVMGPLVKKLRTVSLALQPGKGGIVARLEYADEDATAWAEMHAKRVAENLGKSAELAWAKDAKIGREGNAVTVQVAVPPRLLEELPKARPADLLK